MTSWTTMAPGQQVLVFEEEKAALFLNGDAPDWVRVPPALGGGEARVMATFRSECPQCKGNVRHYELEGGMFVAECPVCTFLWYRLRSVEREAGGSP